jgi:glutamate racemase
MERKAKRHRPIGIFDSGVGGLSVLREVRLQLPEEDLIYIADQAHVPYGIRSRDEVLLFSEGIVRFLLNKKVKLIIIACNTASAVALKILRKSYPALPFVGMEPAVKPAAEETSTGIVGVLATPATFQGALYASTVERFAKGVKILPDTCPGLVECIEEGKIDHPETREILLKALQPMLSEGVDEIVMGCTHYPFVIPLIKEIVGELVQVIDPAPAVARQTSKLLGEYDLLTNGGKPGQTEFLTSGDPLEFKRIIGQLLKLDASVSAVNWAGGDLRES